MNEREEYRRNQMEGSKATLLTNTPKDMIEEKETIEKKDEGTYMLNGSILEQRNVDTGQSEEGDLEGNAQHQAEKKQEEEDKNKQDIAQARDSEETRHSEDFSTSSFTSTWEVELEKSQVVVTIEKVGTFLSVVSRDIQEACELSNYLDVEWSEDSASSSLCTVSIPQATDVGERHHEYSPFQHPDRSIMKEWSVTEGNDGEEYDEDVGPLDDENDRGSSGRSTLLEILAGSCSVEENQLEINVCAECLEYDHKKVPLTSEIDRKGMEIRDIDEGILKDGHGVSVNLSDKSNSKLESHDLYVSKERMKGTEDMHSFNATASSKPSERTQKPQALDIKPKINKSHERCLTQEDKTAKINESHGKNLVMGDKKAKRNKSRWKNLTKEDKRAKMNKPHWKRLTQDSQNNQEVKREAKGVEKGWNIKPLHKCLFGKQGHETNSTLSDCSKGAALFEKSAKNKRFVDQEKGQEFVRASSIGMMKPCLESSVGPGKIKKGLLCQTDEMLFDIKRRAESWDEYESKRLKEKTESEESAGELGGGNLSVEERRTVQRKTRLRRVLKEREKSEEEIEREKSNRRKEWK
ncbi:hypothetical protein ElyMa_001323600 [Elysia marginata]|uniref:Uncharacterized protein n=1 Tax=Elysia marginata TaxID=1093978 RepID=A0AAV4IKQ2_9GAST|nr:hypothetical protein ElyMa_001323600 [Elysia marginata]